MSELSRSVAETWVITQNRVEFFSEWKKGSYGKLDPVFSRHPLEVREFASKEAADREITAISERFRGTPVGLEAIPVIITTKMVQIT